MWVSNDMFHYMFKDEFATLLSLKAPLGREYYVQGMDNHPINIGTTRFTPTATPLLVLISDGVEIWVVLGCVRTTHH